LGTEDGCSGRDGDAGGFFGDDFFEQRIDMDFSDRPAEGLACAELSPQELYRKSYYSVIEMKIAGMSYGFEVLHDTNRDIHFVWVWPTLLQAIGCIDKLLLMDERKDEAY
jgi:hypothetical protein